MEATPIADGIQSGSSWGSDIPLHSLQCPAGIAGVICYA